MCDPVMCCFEAGGWPGCLQSGFVNERRAADGDQQKSRSPRCKRIERVVHFGMEIWGSSKKYCSCCGAGGGDAGLSCSKTSGAA